MRILEVDRKLSHTELDQLETFADRLFAKVGIDVEFTRHFLDRVNDERNVKQITHSELTRLFKQEYKKWGKQIAQLGPDSEAVLKDIATDVNIPFALRWDNKNNELDLIAKTVMRKQDFKTSNKEFQVESFTYDLDNSQNRQIFESIALLMEGMPAVDLLGSMNPADFANKYGAEHLIVCVKEEEEFIEGIKSAGSVFIGNYTPESAGDYASGTNHTLPTNGYVRQYSGVNLDSFLKAITYQKITKEGLMNLGPAIEEMAAAEGLQAHKNAVTLRLKSMK